MPLLTLENLRKNYGGEAILKGVSCEIRRGEHVSLVGPNGAGKTTLLKLLMGQEEPDGGTLSLRPGARIGFLEQHPTFAPGRTVWDEAREAMRDLLALAEEAQQAADALSDAANEEDRRRWAQRFDALQQQLQLRDGYQIDHKIRRVLHGLGFSDTQLEQPVTQLSGGQQNRLMLARLLLEEPDLMLLDEPSNHLDIEATEWLESFLNASQQAILLVSHDRYLLDRIAQRTWELFDGTVDSYKGNFTAYRQQKEERLVVQRRAYEKQQIEIAKMEDFVRKHHHGQKHAQAEDRKKKLERIERVAPPREIARCPMGFPAASRSGDIVLRAEGLSKAYDRPLFGGLSFDILRGEKWGIIGPNGTGKTTLLRCLLDREPPDSGRVIVGTGVKIGYFDQQLSGFDERAEVVDAIRPGHKEFVEQQRRDLLAKFGLTGDMAFQQVGSLSGGERNRTALARLAAEDANFLVLDEPTNHLDLWARDALEDALLAFDGTVLFVSHDRFFINQVADHLLVVEPSGFRVIEGNYETYLHLVKRGLAEGTDAATQQAAGAAPADNGPSAAGRGQTAAGKVSAGKVAAGKVAADRDTKANGKPKGERGRQWKFPYRKSAEIEQEIAETEARIAAVHESMTDPEVLRDGAQVKQLKEDLEDLEEQLHDLYAHWEEAAERGA